MNEHVCSAMILTSATATAGTSMNKTLSLIQVVAFVAFAAQVVPILQSQS